MTIVTAAIAATLALAVPDNFDPQANMLINESGLHSVRDTMNHAARLVSQGGPEDLELAGKMIDAVIQCQERRPDDANYGNFLWYKENGVVEDLNGVSFTLGTMIPMMLRHGDRLPADLRIRIFESIRLGLDATKRLDVSPGYTNIALFDIENTCLGGELLQGKRRFTASLGNRCGETSPGTNAGGRNGPSGLQYGHHDLSQPVVRAGSLGKLRAWQSW
jgi:hypothetical protein